MHPKICLYTPLWFNTVFAVKSALIAGLEDTEVSKNMAIPLIFIIIQSQFHVIPELAPAPLHQLHNSVVEYVAAKQAGF